jgi:hypothetical protein
VYISSQKFKKTHQSSKPLLSHKCINHREREREREREVRAEMEVEMGEAMHSVGTKNHSPPGMSLRLVQELAGHDDRYPAFLIDIVLISWCCV